MEISREDYSELFRNKVESINKNLEEFNENSIKIAEEMSKTNEMLSAFESKIK